MVWKDWAAHMASTTGQDFSEYAIDADEGFSDSAAANGGLRKASIEGGVFDDRFSPPLGLAVAPGWLHPSDAKKSACDALLAGKLPGAFLVRMKKSKQAKGELAYVISTVCPMANKPPVSIEVKVSAKDGAISVEAKGGPWSGVLDGKTAKLTTLAELVEYLSNTRFDGAKGRGWKMQLTSGIRPDGSVMATKWSPSAEGAVDVTKALKDLVTKAPLPQPTVTNPAPARPQAPAPFVPVCTDQCCDLNMGGEPHHCLKPRPERRPGKPKLRFGKGDTVTVSTKPKQGYAVQLVGLAPCTEHEGEPGFLSFRAGDRVYVWNESGDPDAVLGRVDADGRTWLSGWIGNNVEKADFGQGGSSFKEGIFPGDLVGPP
jgi:hypothetical protein